MNKLLIVGPRRSGKTTKLIETALTAKGRVIYFTHSHHLVPEIIKRMKARLREHNTLFVCSHPDRIHAGDADIIVMTPTINSLRGVRADLILIDEIEYVDYEAIDFACSIWNAQGENTEIIATSSNINVNLQDYIIQAIG